MPPCSAVPICAGDPSGSARLPVIWPCTNLASGTALVTGTLADGAKLFRAAARGQRAEPFRFYAPTLLRQGPVPGLDHPDQLPNQCLLDHARLHQRHPACRSSNRDCGPGFRAPGGDWIPAILILSCRRVFADTIKARKSKQELLPSEPSHRCSMRCSALPDRDFCLGLVAAQSRQPNGARYHCGDARTNRPIPRWLSPPPNSGAGAGDAAGRDYSGSPNRAGASKGFRRVQSTAWPVPRPAPP